MNVLGMGPQNSLASLATMPQSQPIPAIFGGQGAMPFMQQQPMFPFLGQAQPQIHYPPPQVPIPGPSQNIYLPNNTAMNQINPLNSLGNHNANPINMNPNAMFTNPNQRRW